jgi:hypothetical protein
MFGTITVGRKETRILGAMKIFRMFDVHESMHRHTIMNITNKMQLHRFIYFFYLSALHVSGDVSTHFQEHLTVFTVFGSIHPSCCRLVPAATWMNTTILPDTLNTVKCS